jgi:L-Ala-D/L-Glu epimerase
VIERVEVHPLGIPRGDGMYHAVLLVLHKDGICGLGEAPALAARGGDVAALCAELAERRPRHAAARAAWAAAELDLAARAAGVPTVDLLGGARRREVRCNRLIGEASPVAVARRVEAAAAAGYATFKLKAAGGGGPLDLERLGAARWAAGRGGRLRLDCNGVLSREAACRVLPTLDAFRLELVEQPLPPEASPADWRLLANACRSPLAADESLGEPERARELAAAGIGLAMKLATVGGPRAALELAARAAGPVLLSSSYETSVGLAAALHTACALAAEPLDCGLATRDLLEADVGLGLVAEGPLLRLGVGPGLGVELDRRALARYRLER